MERLVLVDCPGLSVDGLDAQETDRRLRAFARVVDALSEVCPWVDPVRPGVCTLPVRGPARYFGGEPGALAALAAAVAGVTEGCDPPVGLKMGVAEGVFAAALASQVGAVVPSGGTPAFLAPWPVAELATPALGELLPRLGLRTLGEFAALEPADVAARFGAAGAMRHRLARGTEGELPDWRVRGLAQTLAAFQHGIELREHQPGFWGGAGAADERAAEALVDLQRRLGPEAVAVAVLGGGRTPGERARLVPWRADLEAGAADARPWPGRLPTPSPARVPPEPLRAEVIDASGAEVRVGGRGLFTAEPDRVSVDGGPWEPLTGWSAPWPLEERWWARPRRRAAHVQMTTAGGRAHLLVAERGRWWLAATYD